MSKNRKSLFEELNSLSLEKNKERMVEQKGENIIAGAINLIEYIQEEFDEEVSADLVKRLVNSIRTQDPRKFKRGCKNLSD